MLALLLSFACAPLDDNACVAVPFDAECPSEEDAADDLVGGETCTDPVEVITRTGAFLERVEDCYVDDPEHTACCCYEAHLRERHGETCLPEGEEP